jgi:hypothetical protein
VNGYADSIEKATAQPISKSIALDLEALQVLGEPHLEAADFQQQIGFLQQFLALAGVFRLYNTCRFKNRSPSAVRGKAVKQLRRNSPRWTEADTKVAVRQHAPITVGGADVHRSTAERAATQHNESCGYDL